MLSVCGEASGPPVSRPSETGTIATQSGRQGGVAVLEWYVDALPVGIGQHAKRTFSGETSQQTTDFDPRRILKNHTFDGIVGECRGTHRESSAETSETFLSPECGSKPMNLRPLPCC